MARRLIDSKIVDSDMFLDLPLSSQSLYFHLCLKADDDGFIDNPKTIQRSLGCTNDDLKLLFAKEYIIPFKSGIVVITHWNIHNSIRKDRKKSTIHQLEFSQLILDENKKYSLRQPNGNQMTTKCQPNDRLSKDKLSKDKLSKDNTKTIPYQKIVDIYNSTCIKLPKVVRLTDNRKKAIKARYMEYEKDISIFETLFKKVNESDFLQGINGEWKANFDWLLKQQSMVKVLEDRYINKHNQKNKESELVKNAIFGQNS